MTIQNITILGTGNMGVRMAKHLLDGGYHLSVFNRDKQKTTELVQLGAKYFSTPKQAVASADLVISMLTDDKAANDVWLNQKTGAIHSMPSNAIAIESSTLSVACINELNKEFTEKNIAFLDAPVLGSRPQADAAVLIYLVGGDKSAHDRVEPVFKLLSSAIYYLGKSGNGAKMKLAVNAYFSSQVSALSEVYSLLKKSGINTAQSVELFNLLPTTSPALQGIGQLIANENFEPFFPINLVEKDLRYIRDLAKQNNTEIPTIAAAHTNFKTAIERGLGEDNIAGLVQLWS